MGKREIPYCALVGKSERNNHTEIPGCIWMGNSKMYLNKIGCVHVD
jgi:hypothetical protein